MYRLPWSPLACAFVVLVSGCVGAPFSSDAGAKSGKTSRADDRLDRPQISPDWFELVLPVGEGHNHRDPLQHQHLSTPNFQELGWDSLVTDYYGTSAAMHLCGQTQEKNGQRITVVHSWGTDVAFVLADTTDVRNPKKIGELVMPNTVVYDVAITPDLRYVLLGTYPYAASLGEDKDPVAAEASGDAYWRDACTGETIPVRGPEQGLPYAAGIVLVDISNPRVPAIQDFLLFPIFGSHSVRAYDVNGRTVVVSTVLNLVHEISYYVFMTIQQTPAGGKLVVQSIYNGAVDNVQRDRNVYGRANPVGGGHDMFLQKHPLTGEWLVYLADGPNGLVILNLNDITQPKFVSRWKDWSVLGKAAPPDPYAHSALPIEGVWDGHHYTFLGEECLSHRQAMPSCAIFTLDTTDPKAPKFVGAWALPKDVPWEKSLEFSTHYIAVQNRTLFITVYHGGLWAIDVSTPEALRLMPSIGAYLPANVPPKPAKNANRIGAYPLDHTPIVLDLDVMSDGTLVLFDATSGLYTVRFDDTNPAPPPTPWPLGYNQP